MDVVHGDQWHKFLIQEIEDERINMTYTAS